MSLTAAQSQKAIRGFEHYKKFFDNSLKANVVKISPGDYYITDQQEIITTVLGSCISACVRDKRMKIGGMNHFLLPDTHYEEGRSSLRFGAYAMEELINGILQLGGKKERLEVKIFGGGNVIESSQNIGEKNIRFVLDYLRTEGLPVASQNVGGPHPRRVHYYPDTGKAMVRTLRREEDQQKVTEEEKSYKQYIDIRSHDGSEGDVELFE